MGSDNWQLLLKQLRNLPIFSKRFVFIYFERDRVWILFVGRGSAIFVANSLKSRTLASDHVTCARVRCFKLLAQNRGPSRVITWPKLFVLLRISPTTQKSFSDPVPLVIYLFFKKNHKTQFQMKTVHYKKWNDLQENFWFIAFISKSVFLSYLSGNTTTFQWSKCPNIETCPKWNNFEKPINLTLDECELKCLVEFDFCLTVTNPILCEKNDSLITLKEVSIVTSQGETASFFRQINLD